MTPTYPIIKQISPTLWRVEEEICYKAKSSVEVRVKKGFISDGMSWPLPITWPIVPAFIHDALYAKPQGYLDGDIIPFTRKQCDLYFFWAMHDWAVKPGIRELAYTMVRWFGWYPWNCYRKRKPIASKIISHT